MSLQSLLPLSAIGDGEAGHGLQVFDLTRLRGVSEPRMWTEDAHYAVFGRAHNVAINEDTGYADAVGSNTCSGGLHMIDIRDPKVPVFAGCVADDGDRVYEANYRRGCGSSTAAA